MTWKVRSAIALLCLVAVALGGCKKKTPSPGETARTVLASIQTQPSLPLSDAFAAPGVRWDDGQGTPWAAARSLGEMCKLSYAAEAEVNAQLSKWGFGTVSHFVNGSLYACVASDEQTVLVAFRGTDDAKDWLVNTDAIPQSVPQGIVHRGFYEGMKTLYAEVAAAAADQGADKKRLWITGHSLGGALAVAFAYETLAQGGPRPAGVVTFGQPLVADRVVGEYVGGRLGGNYVRFVNGHDVVTRVPPGYAHFGKLMWLDEGKLVTDAKLTPPKAAEIAPLSAAEFDALKQGFRDARKLGKGIDAAQLRSYGEQVAAITDHFMDAYLRGIDAAAR